MSKTVAQRVEEIPKHYQIHPLDLRIDKEIASGNFGSVFHGKLWNQDVAVKVCNCENESDRAEFLEEVRYLHKVRHPNIVSMLGFYLEKKRNVLVQELMEHGSLASWISDHFQSQQNAKEKLMPVFRKIAFSLAVALNWVHHCGIIHRDVKPENVLFHHDAIKLCDFGLACDMKIVTKSTNSNSSISPVPTSSLSSSSSSSSLSQQPERSSNSNEDVIPVQPLTNQKITKKRKLDCLYIDPNHPTVFETRKHIEQTFSHGFAGTPSLQAPEVIESKCYDSKCDVFSFAMTLCHMFRGQDPYLVTEGIKANKSIVNNKRPPLPRYLPKDYARLIRQCWQQDPSKRPTMQMVVQRLAELNTISPISSSVVGWSSGSGLFWRIRKRKNGPKAEVSATDVNKSKEELGLETNISAQTVLVNKPNGLVNDLEDKKQTAVKLPMETKRSQQ